MCVGMRDDGGREGGGATFHLQVFTNQSHLVGGNLQNNISRVCYSQPRPLLHGSKVDPIRKCDTGGEREGPGPSVFLIWSPSGK